MFRAIQSGRLYDRFRRRIMFPIANEAGKVIAFGGRAMGDDMPKYLNSPETPIYSKSNVLYHLDRAKEALRQADFAILGGRLHGRDRRGARRIRQRGRQLRHQPHRDAGQIARPLHAARHRELRSGHRRPGRHRTLARASARKQNSTCASSRCPAATIPTTSSRSKARTPTASCSPQAPPYLDYLIGRARQMDRTTAEENSRAVNFLMPYVQRIPEPPAAFGMGLAHRPELRVDEPVLREALRRAAAERRSEVKPNAELLGPSRETGRAAIDPDAR